MWSENTLEAQEGTETGEEYLVIEIEDATDGPDGLLVVGAGAPDLIHVAHALLRELVQPDGVLLHGEDVDVDALLAPQAVVAVLFLIMSRKKPVQVTNDVVEVDGQGVVDPREERWYERFLPAKRTKENAE